MLCERGEGLSMRLGDSKPIEDFMMWSAMMPGIHQNASVGTLKRLVNDWITMATQKTDGKRKGEKGIPWVKGSKPVSIDNLERIKMGILCEACMLVLSGRLDALEAEDPVEVLSMYDGMSCG